MVDQVVKGRLGSDEPTALAPPSGVEPASGLQQSRSSTDAALAIQIEDILGNGPMKEPKDYPTVGSSCGYHGNDPDAPDDTVITEAFNQGHTRAWWEACQMLEPVLAALRAPGTDWFAGDVDCDGNELITIRKDEWERLNSAYLSAVKGRQDFRAAYREARTTIASGIVAATAGETEGLDERSEQSPVGASRDAHPGAGQ